MKDWIHVEASDVVRGDVIDYEKKVAEVRSVERDQKGQMVIECKAARTLVLSPSTKVEVYR